jgi:glycosyltransferase involved in cell wall biosynthesis
MSGRSVYDLSIVGTVGLPAAYGGFETLAEQLAQRISYLRMVQVFCTGKGYPDINARPLRASGADLRYVEWDANGWQSMPYDFVSLWRAARQTRTILVLGVSGCLLLPVVRLLWPRTRIVTNVDGLEWKRQKWGPLARAVLRISEWAAVRFSHAVVADNQGICEHIAATYRRQSHLIAYGGDQAATLAAGGAAVHGEPLRDTRFAPDSYFFGVCRIEPENHIAEILEAFSNTPKANLVLVGNWGTSDYAQRLRNQYSHVHNIELKDPIYDQVRLQQLRVSARAYIHGHSAGGTNPSLVEAMHAAMPVLAYKVHYNRYTTHNQAIYWQDSGELAQHLRDVTTETLRRMGGCMAQIAQRHYTWSVVTQQYADILFTAP